ncbi:hypothetical protein TCSYLVIO_003417 [Trypanosoma cruzi]|nr:hypothetical protein TCSYLVIO_003417 [Trypanosoma cruzi]
MRWLPAQLRGCGTGRRDRIAAVVARTFFLQRCHASSTASTFGAHDGEGLNNRDTGKPRRSSRGGTSSHRPNFARRGGGEGQQLGESKKEEEGASATTIQGGNNSSGGFSLGNGMEVQQPALSPFVEEDNIGVNDVFYGRNEARTFNEDALVSAIEGMHPNSSVDVAAFFSGGSRRGCLQLWCDEQRETCKGTSKVAGGAPPSSGNRLAALVEGLRHNSAVCVFRGGGMPSSH